MRANNRGTSAQKTHFPELIVLGVLISVLSGCFDSEMEWTALPGSQTSPSPTSLSDFSAGEFEGEAPSAPAISINDGVPHTVLSHVSLRLGAGGADEMYISNSGDCGSGDWESFKTTKSWRLKKRGTINEVSVKFRSLSGMKKESKCVSASIRWIIPQVEATYPNHGSQWNDYVINSDGADTACTSTAPGGTTACLHGGEKKKVVFLGVNTCSGLSMTDALDAFRWVCTVRSGTATFHSVGLKSDRGLRNLVDETAWKNNSVTLTGLAETVSSEPAKWWTNTVQTLPDNSAGGDTVATLASEGTIYTLASSRASQGYNINADKVGIVTLGSSVLSYGGSANTNCNDLSGEIGVTYICLLAAGAQNFLWVEARLHGTAGGTNMAMALVFADVTRSVVRDSHLTSAITRGLSLYNSRANIFSNLRASNTQIGVYMFGATENLFSQYFGLNNGDVALKVMASSDSNRFVQVTSTNNENYTITLSGSSLNSFSQVNSSNNNWPGIMLTGASNFNTFSNVVATNNSGSGIAFWAGTQNTMSQVVSMHNLGTGFELSTSTHNKFIGNLLLGQNGSLCTVDNSANNPGLVNATCTFSGTSGTSDYNAWSDRSTATMRLGLDASGSYVGAATTDSTNVSHVTGSALFSLTMDWHGFDSIFRGWGRQGGSAISTNGANNDPCYAANTCQIFDWRLNSADTTLLNRTGDGITANSAFIAGSTCPTEVAGSVYGTDQQTTPNTFLLNASELVLDGVGDDDGLCESNEHCLYTPNFGSYQGQGDFYSNTCHFQDGTVSGVKIYAYPSNGI